MVRFEKLAYEQIINSAVLNRNRKIVAPSKFFPQNRYKAIQVDGMRFTREGLTGIIYRII
jgi:hypothetical protein